MLPGVPIDDCLMQQALWICAGLFTVYNIFESAAFPRVQDQMTLLGRLLKSEVSRTRFLLIETSRVSLVFTSWKVFLPSILRHESLVEDFRQSCPHSRDFDNMLMLAKIEYATRCILSRMRLIAQSLQQCQLPGSHNIRASAISWHPSNSPGQYQYIRRSHCLECRKTRSSSLANTSTGNNLVDTQKGGYASPSPANMVHKTQSNSYPDPLVVYLRVSFTWFASIQGKGWEQW